MALFIVRFYAMSLRDWMTRQGRARWALARRIDKATNKWMQSIDRMKALEELKKTGSEEALYGLLKRFSVVSDKSIEDEQEKDWVFQTLVDFGEQTLPPLRRYLKNAATISWPLRLADRLLDHDHLWEVLQEVLSTMEPGYERDPTRKLQLFGFLGDWRDKRVAPAIVPYLEDMDETVRFAAVETLARQRDEVAREPLLTRLVDTHEESWRIKMRILDGLADLGWTVHGFRGQVEKLLPEEFALDREGHVKRKARAS